MTSRTLFVLSLPVASFFIASGGCLELQAPTPNENGGQGGAEPSSSSSSSSSSSGSGGQGGVGAGGSGQGGISPSSSASSSSGAAPTVWCNGAECAPAEICCFRPLMQAMNHCGQTGACGVGSVELSCNEQADCPGQICCATFNNATFSDISCKLTCAGQGKYILCTDDASVCPAGTTCKQSQTAGNGYRVCY